MAEHIKVSDKGPLRGPFSFRSMRMLTLRGRFPSTFALMQDEKHRNDAFVAGDGCAIGARHV